jgi:hypothetical protein
MGNAVSWGAQPSIIADPGASGAIPTTEGWGVCSIVTAGVETRTLAIPQRVGQRLSLAMKTDGGNCTLTAASAINETGNNTLLFQNVGEYIALEAIEAGAALAWRVIANDSVTLSTV